MRFSATSFLSHNIILYSQKTLNSLPASNTANTHATVLQKVYSQVKNAIENCILYENCNCVIL